MQQFGKGRKKTHWRGYCGSGHCLLARASATMAQLPPKVPHAAAAGNWHGFGHGHHQRGSEGSWVDEFLDFSAAKRAAHRRSASDSIAFLEAAPLDGAGGGEGGGHEFDRLDDDQLMSMFSDEAPPSPEEKQQRKCEAGEAENEIAKLEQSAAASEQIFDPKRVKRILANRQSAQRSRVRKLQYISELERSVTSLETEVSALSPRVAFLDQQRSLLTLGNSHLKQRIAALAQDKIFKDAHQEALRKEIERLRQVYYQQSLKKAKPDTSLRTEELLSCNAATTTNCAPTT
ncbi:basic leucine zipper 6-like [Canna indica]|uniref:Basic leucine zipper 6-like n=1 Tax=Canna indica TaxID=4628 RepID=A0AAQ3Q3L1_9LILI|nr:basic leucine zipper 6-like [Canna indica]